MKFHVLYEIERPRPWGETSILDCYWDALEQLRVAEEAGFETVWSVEHHFLASRVAARRRSPTDLRIPRGRWNRVPSPAASRTLTGSMASRIARPSRIARWGRPPTWNVSGTPPGHSPCGGARPTRPGTSRG